MEFYVRIWTEVLMMLLMCCLECRTISYIYRNVFYVDTEQISNTSSTKATARSHLECTKSCFHSSDCLSILYGDVTSDVKTCLHVKNVQEVYKEHVYDSKYEQLVNLSNIWLFIPLYESSWVLKTATTTTPEVTTATTTTEASTTTLNRITTKTPKTKVPKEELLTTLETRTQIATTAPGITTSPEAATTTTPEAATTTSAVPGATTASLTTTPDAATTATTEAVTTTSAVSHTKTTLSTTPDAATTPVKTTTKTTASLVKITKETSTSSSFLSKTDVDNPLLMK